MKDADILVDCRTILDRTLYLAGKQRYNADNNPLTYCFVFLFQNQNGNTSTTGCPAATGAAQQGEINMKAFALAGILLLPIAAFAQYPQNMSEMDMGKMMQQAQAMQACMEQVDQAALQEFQQRAMEVNNEIKSLCTAGKRDKAQKLAMDFGREAEKNKAVQEMKKCGELAKDMMPQQMPGTHEELDYSTQHVCDNLEE